MSICAQEQTLVHTSMDTKHCVCVCCCPNSSTLKERKKGGNTTSFCSQTVSCACIRHASAHISNPIIVSHIYTYAYI